MMFHHAIGVITTIFTLLFISCVMEGEDSRGQTVLAGMCSVLTFGLYIYLTESWGLVLALLSLVLFVIRYTREDKVRHVQSRDKK